MPEVRRRFDKDFREGAVRIVLETGRPVAEVARELGVHDGSFKTELVYRIVLPTMAVARREIVAWLDRYNRVRRHSHCALQAPMTYERLTTPAALAA